MSRQVHTRAQLQSPPLAFSGPFVSCLNLFFSLWPSLLERPSDPISTRARLLLVPTLGPRALHARLTLAYVLIKTNRRLAPLAYPRPRLPRVVSSCLRSSIS
ncbi:hypothetical protein PIIN_02581 [Serendipita indica DSM 11827]|uniref:Uncharacterized protein n=1 Tax=Serendipita indica (strain DSM 11827) TaxID=1109443 RepID=G4TBL3_SERID|nr:hypothetical protein PIIN_02581 [Serendipita indica DSM 11827]